MRQEMFAITAFAAATILLGVPVDAHAVKIYACINTSTSVIQVKAEGALCPGGSSAIEFTKEAA